MPRLPQRSQIFTALRPAGAAIAGAGLVLAITASSSGAASQAAGLAAARPAAPAPRPASAGALALNQRQVTHAARSMRRDEWVRPVPGPVTSWFGPRWGARHPGIDIGAPYGTPVHAITAGWIVSAGWIPGYGKVVRVWAGGNVFYYPHLSRILHRHGFVQTGEVVGRVGSTGYSTGPHLHIEIRHHGRAFNPFRILWEHGVRL